MRFFATALLILLPLLAHAGVDRVEGRLLAGRLFSSPTTFNSEMSTIGLTDFGSLDKVGAEASYNVMDRLGFGLRFLHNSASDTTKSYSTSSHQTSISQDTLQLIARVPLIKNSFFRLDAFGGYGISNNTISIDAASETGTLERKNYLVWSDTAVSSYGASAAIGFKGFSLFVEVGKEQNNVRSFDRTGTVNSNINSLDLSGDYWLAGLILDGRYVSFLPTSSSSSK